MPFTREREKGREHRSMERKLWTQIDMRDPDECWPWIGRIGNRGYGIISSFGRQTSAHRAVFEAMWGERLPSWLVIHHTCENRLCANPCDLAVVTRSEHPRLHAPDVCKRGHLRIPENLYANRACRICAKMRRERVI